MKFSDLLKNDKQDSDIPKKNSQILVESTKNDLNEAKEPSEILRGAGKKIKLITPTSFGTQIDFAKKYEDEEIKDLLKDFTIKIKNKSVFIVD